MGMHAFRRLREQEAEARVLAATAPTPVPSEYADGGEASAQKRTRRSKANAASLTEN